MPASTVMVVVGTRPEAIKMAPVIKALQARPSGKTILCVTAQHREMLDQALQIFELKPDIDLNLMTPGQDLITLTARALTGLRDAIRQTKPDALLVHGDTTTCLAGGLAAAYERVPLGHVEAGLRTYNFEAPWPEEMNRRLVDPLCGWCFAPTEAARQNLLSERIPDANIVITGNTAIDALHLGMAAVRRTQTQPPAEVEAALQGRRMVLVTGHRRESFGGGFENICHGLRDLADSVPDALIVYPVHLNPNVQGPVKRILADHPRIILLDPQPYLPFLALMERSTLIITDSGGIQEEAPTLGKPVLVMRETTERPEAVEAGAAMLVGADRTRIAKEGARLLTDTVAYRLMAGVRNPYGDGHAAERIVSALSK
ncbi:MAG TPA: UDP-N-acetylglucosamine 2-epimerase (non-hydrolyzing) [Planctomycetota bacterium]|nr:UDP-N-acetylglucosamine 2-epimerase (non-hydrolyzing) [Planctomycetota bacterium]